MEHTGTACNRNSSTSPTTFFIINTGIKTILNIFLILLVVSTHTASKMNTLVTIFIVPATLDNFNWSSFSKQDDGARHSSFLLGFLIRNTPACRASRHFLPCSHLQTWVPVRTSGACLSGGALTRKDCWIFLLLPENIMGVHILNIFLQMSRSCLPAGIILL